MDEIKWYPTGAGEYPRGVRVPLQMYARVVWQMKANKSVSHHTLTCDIRSVHLVPFTGPVPGDACVLSEGGTS